MQDRYSFQIVANWYDWAAPPLQSMFLKMYLFGLIRASAIMGHKAIIPARHL